MKRLLCVAAAIAATSIGGSVAASAADASPIGDWLVKDGYAHIRIDNCGGKMWGIVAWEKAPGLDSENPDAAKRTRPTLGMPILLGLAPNAKEPGKYSGKIYNSQNGKLYDATISLANEDTLDLEGCLVWPLCQTQKWTRVKTPPANAAPLPPIKGAAPNPPSGNKKSTKNAAAITTSDTCLRVAEEVAEQQQQRAKK